MSGLLTPERLAGLRINANRLVRHHDGAAVDPQKDHPATDGTSCRICDDRALHRHIDAQEAEIRELANALDLLHDRDVWMHCEDCQHPKCVWRRKDVEDAGAVLAKARAAGLLPQ